MPIWEAFIRAFTAVYAVARGEYDDEAWANIWGDNALFSNFMLYNQCSVIRRTAAGMGLGCYRGEPLHLDAVFTNDAQQGWNWFPPVVAIEHENNPKGFHGEVEKLLSVRAKLKVGITYWLIGDRGNPDDLGANLVGMIANLFNQARENIPENDGTEYLFILGVEGPERILTWHTLNFTAGQGVVANMAFALINPQ